MYTYSVCNLSIWYIKLTQVDQAYFLWQTNCNVVWQLAVSTIGTYQGNTNLIRIKSKMRIHFFNEISSAPPILEGNNIQEMKTKVNFQPKFMGILKTAWIFYLHDILIVYIQFLYFNNFIKHSQMNFIQLSAVKSLREQSWTICSRRNRLICHAILLRQ